MKTTDRRKFILELSALTAAVMVPFPSCKFGAASSDRLGALLPQRLLGKTGEKVTMMGVGGWHIGDMPESGSQRVIEAALEGGIRLFDTAQSYQDGESEIRYGKYLTPKYREDVFLFSKTGVRTAEEASAALDATLKRLKTDYLDLWTMHAVGSPEDVDKRFQAGVYEVILKAKQEGKVRHIGFTGHTTWKAHLDVLGRDTEFATCQLPVNVADPSYESFILNVMPELEKQNFGILAMKTLGGGGLFGAAGEMSGPDPARKRIIPDLLSVEEAMHFAWSLPISTIISGTNNVDELQKNLAAANSFVKMSEEDRNALVAKVADLSATGEMEWYKA